MKTGDTVRHHPTGETWTVAFVEDDKLAWCGWPEGLADVSDCELVDEATPEDSLKLIRELATMGKNDKGRDDMRCRWAKHHLMLMEESPFA